MGCTPRQSARAPAACPSMHRKGTPGRPCAPHLPGGRAAAGGSRAQAAVRCGLCGACVLSCLGVPVSRARRGPGGTAVRASPATPLRSAPQRPPGSSLRAFPLAAHTRPAPPRTTTVQIAARRAAGPGARPPCRASGEQGGLRGWGSLSAGARVQAAAGGSALEGWRGLGGILCCASSAGVWVLG